MKNSTKCYCGHTTTCDCGPEEPKQETFEEVAEKFATDKQNEDTSKYYIALESFQLGAKWQQERMYSEEEVKEILFHRETEYLKTKSVLHINEWFEQFKKK